jgi:hypothetical protein
MARCAQCVTIDTGADNSSSDPWGEAAGAAADLRRVGGGQIARPSSRFGLRQGSSGVHRSPSRSTSWLAGPVGALRDRSQRLERSVSGGHATTRAARDAGTMPPRAEFAALVTHIVENRYFNATTVSLDAGTRLV